MELNTETPPGSTTGPRKEGKEEKFGNSHMCFGPLNMGIGTKPGNKVRHRTEATEEATK